MNSSTFRTLEKKKTKEEIKKKIELLKAQLEEEEDVVENEDGAGVVQSEKEKNGLLDKRKNEGGGVLLAPDTPSPRKRRKISHPSSLSVPTIPKPTFLPKSSSSMQSSSSSSMTTTRAGLSQTHLHPQPKPSTLFSTYLKLEKAAEAAELEIELKEQVIRTDGFEQKPRPQPRARDTPPEEVKGDGNEEGRQRTRRDERLVLVEDFEMGPYEFTPPVNDPTFENVEPHSGIVLSSRVLPHADLSSYLLGRFYISPSKLYSLLRLDTHTSKGGGGGYDVDVPVPGDWVTIAVIAERGPIKYTKAPVGVDKDEEEKKKKKKWDGKGKGVALEEDGGGGGGGGKKYVTLKMIDFGARSSSSSSGLGGSGIRGDAMLNLILFEADRVDLISNGGSSTTEKVYKGGSGGAFEKLMNVREGDVIALLNPRVLKPFSRANDGQTIPILALTPSTASSIMVIGRSRDLGMCTVRKADGKVCGAWCDKRDIGAGAGEVCEFHLEKAVIRQRAGRNEFAIGTSGMSTSALHKRKHDYDPLRKWGLKPSASGGGGNSRGGGGLGATYVFGGHVVSNHNFTASGGGGGGSGNVGGGLSKGMFVAETMGREAQARARRKMGKGKEEEGLLVSRVGAGVGKGKSKADLRGSESEDEEDLKKKKRHLYSAEFVKSLGFDPSLKVVTRRGGGETSGSGRGVDKTVQDKVKVLEALRKERKTEPKLGRRPGERIRSGVVVPKSVMVDLDDDD